MLARSVGAVGGVIAATAVLMAIALTWLLLQDPAAVVDAVGGGGGRAVIEAVALAIVQVLQQVVRWL